LNYYRTPVPATGEENFPYRYGDLDLNNPTAETIALMKIINGKPFDFISSLHNMAFGFGITFQVSEPCPLLCAPFQELAKASGIFLRKRVGFMLALGVQFGRHLTPVSNYIRFRAGGKVTTTTSHRCMRAGICEAFKLALLHDDT